MPSASGWKDFSNWRRTERSECEGTCRSIALRKRLERFIQPRPTTPKVSGGYRPPRRHGPPEAFL
ncbi:MAG: hypothetical protein LBQ54_00905 [Planctomycetaceae bacterium]|nr:hypothetical protein [Planctomycetaceae bacterium]